MKQNSEKYEDILLYELEALKEIKTNLFEYAEQHTSYVDIVKGTALGLILGIGGNLFVQFFVPTIEAILLGEYKETFIEYLAISAISLFIIVLVSAYLYWHLLKDKKELKLSGESIDVLEYAIKRRQYNLKQKKDGEQPTSSR